MQVRGLHFSATETTSVDRWLECVRIIISILLYLLATQTATILTLCCLLIWIFSIHPVITLWEIGVKNWRRVLMLALSTVAVAWLGLHLSPLTNSFRRGDEIKLWTHGAKVEWGPLRDSASAPTLTAPFFFTFYEPNTGQLDALDVTRSYAWRLTDKQGETLRDNEVDKGMRIAKAGLMHPKTKDITNKIPAGDTRTWFVADNPALSMPDFSNVMWARRRLYLMAVIGYRDSETPPGHGTFTEFCGYFEGSFTFYHACNGHNLIYTAALPK